jgi:3-phytase
MQNQPFNVMPGARRRSWRAGLLAAWLLAAGACGEARGPAETTGADQPMPSVAPVRDTEAVPHDPDDPAIWVSPTDPGSSLILATDKQEEAGGLYVFGLDGRLRQAITPLDRPNNVDVEYGFTLGSERIDIAVATERMRRRLRIFRIPADGGPLVDLAPSGLTVLEGQDGEAGEPMGIALYRRPRDGAVFAIVSPKTGGPTDYLWQYRLESSGSTITATLVRRFGSFSGIGPAPDEPGEIEAVAVDDELGYVYYSDERFGIHKWHADPEAPAAAVEIAVFGTDGYLGDREGLAVFARADGTGYLVSSDQVEGGSRLHVYRREGDAGAPHVHSRLAAVRTPSDDTDGLDVASRPLPGFPAGMLVMMNSGPRTFQIYRWDDVAAAMAEVD